jgi:hypothetical protein
MQQTIPKSSQPKIFGNENIPVINRHSRGTYKMLKANLGAILTSWLKENSVSTEGDTEKAVNPA